MTRMNCYCELCQGGPQTLTCEATCGPPLQPKASCSPDGVCTIVETIKHLAARVVCEELGHDYTDHGQYGPDSGVEVLVCNDCGHTVSTTYY